MKLTSNSYLFVFVALLVFSFGSEANDQVVEEARQSLQSGEYLFFEGQKTNIRNPFEMRDPFRMMLPAMERPETSGIRTDFNFSNMPSLDNVSIDQIRITGILLGENRRAIAKIVRSRGVEQEVLSDESYMLKEGMKLGEYDAEIKAILPGGVVLVEQILNVYDQYEFIETILPVRPE